MSAVAAAVVVVAVVDFELIDRMQMLLMLLQLLPLVKLDELVLKLNNQKETWKVTLMKTTMVKVVMSMKMNCARR